MILFKTLLQEARKKEQQYGVYDREGILLFELSGNDDYAYNEALNLLHYSVQRGMLGYNKETSKMFSHYVLTNHGTSVPLTAIGWDTANREACDLLGLTVRILETKPHK